MPPDIWADVLSCTSYTDILQCAALSKFFLVEVSTKIKQKRIIIVMHPAEMRAGMPSSRYTGVSDVTTCMFQDQDADGRMAESEPNDTRSVAFPRYNNLFTWDHTAACFKPKSAFVFL